MGSRIIITESDREHIRGLYEQSVTLPTTITGNYTAKDCDELHAFQSTSGKVVGNMNVIVGKKLEEIYNSGVNPIVTKVDVKVNNMTVSWSVTISESTDGKAWVGFTSRGAGCNNDVHNRAVSVAQGNDMNTAKEKIKKTFNEANIDITMVNDFEYQNPKNGFRQVFYRYTRPSSFPSKSVNKGQVSQPAQKTNNTVTIQGTDLLNLRKKLLEQTQGISINQTTLKVDMNNYKVTYELGNVKIKNMSLIFSPESREELLNRAKKLIEPQNEGSRYVEEGEIDENGKHYWWFLGFMFEN